MLRQLQIFFLSRSSNPNVLIMRVTNHYLIVPFTMDALEQLINTINDSNNINGPMKKKKKKKRSKCDTAGRPFDSLLNT